MWSTISTFAPTVWAWIPQATVGLKFATTVIGFCLAADLAVQRLRRK